MNDDIFELIDVDKGLLEDTVGIIGAARTMLKTMKVAKPLNRRMVVDSWKAAEAFRPELVVYHHKALGAVSIAEKFGAPAIMAPLQPLLAPTAEYPPIGLPALKLGGWYNRLAYKLVALGFRTYAKDIDEVRREYMGLEKFPKSAGVWQMAGGSPIPIIHGYSAHVIPPPKDWPDYYAAGGYWFLDRAADWEPAPELQAFLESGPPPVYVGFGSMSGSNPQRITSIVVDALQQAGVRGIIATGWGGLETAGLPDNIFRIDQAPHDWLFPRVSAVVHHGGAGTVAAGLRAGRATLVCPFFGDQPFWGKKVHELGAGPEPIPQKKLAVDKLAAALKTITTDAAMQAKAQRLGAKIRAEDGVNRTVAMIEQIAQQHGRPDRRPVMEGAPALVNQGGE